MKRCGPHGSRLLLCSLILLLVGGCASMHGDHGMGSRDPVADRQRLMKLIGGSWADIQAKVKSGAIEAVAVNAETIAVSAGHIPALFPKNSLGTQSKARPEIWRQWENFAALAKTTEGLAVNLRDKARLRDTAGVEAAVKEFGPKTCAACHTAFRAAR